MLTPEKKMKTVARVYRPVTHEKHCRLRVDQLL
jgi:hypothetical protein